MSNRVEELESQVAELQAAVDGLTEELVETRERLRQLESEVGVDEATPDRQAVEPAGDAGDGTTSIADPDPVAEPTPMPEDDAPPADEVGPEGNAAGEGSDSDSDSDGSDIIVA